MYVVPFPISCISFIQFFYPVQGGLALPALRDAPEVVLAGIAGIAFSPILLAVVFSLLHHIHAARREAKVKSPTISLICDILPVRLFSDVSISRSPWKAPW